MHYKKQNKAFTLVELIVVVTILAILATIGFVSYSSYLTGVRDTNRLAQLVSIHD
jgi:prepilin-type N-terminal cleavage/methylation domain-containing protein